MRTIRIPFGRVGATAAAAVVLAGGLAGCGGGSSAGAATETNGGPAAAGAPSAGRSGGFRMDPALQQKVQDCLKAAGIAVPSFSGRPSGSFSPRPSGSRPSGSFTRRPGGGGAGGRYADPKTQAALKACGITLPSGGQGGGGQGGGGQAAQPTASS